jgi:peptidoglycan/xylan/chitin deacetylase (PgdA/CDA1 family)
MPTKFVLGNLYKPLKLFNSFAKSKGNRITILNYHGIPKKDLDNFRLQIEWLHGNYKLISPQDFHTFLNRKLKIEDHAVLISFDDGFESSYKATRDILDPMEIKAQFFLLSDFVGDKNLNSWKGFVTNNIYKSSKIGAQVFDYQKPMSTKEIESLINNGHLMGAHTSTHPNLCDLSSKDQLEHELFYSKKKLEKDFEISIHSMAYPFGGIEHINEEVIKYISQYYTYCYSNIRGDNTISTSPLAIRRQNITPDMPITYLGFIIEGGLDWYWVNHRNQLDKFVLSAI